MDDQTKPAISAACLHGRPVPRSLEVLWDVAEETRSELFGIGKLLQDSGVLDEGYGEALLEESEDIAANVRAHRETFREIGFFAELDGGDLLGYWLESGQAEPPIVKLDTEGTYSWEGVDAGEALLRLAIDREQEDEAREWLAGAGLDPGELGEVGVATQTLPDVDKRKDARYYVNLGTPKELAPNPGPIDPDESVTWLLQPAGQVAEVMRRFTGAPLQRFSIWTDGRGLTASLALNEGLDQKTGTLGVRGPTTRDAVVARLGKPDAEGKEHISYFRPPARVNYRFDNAGALKSINIGLIAG